MLDILCIGSSIVDHIVFVTDDWFNQKSEEWGLEKGGVLSISLDEFESILHSLSFLNISPPLIKAGGSAATTAKGLAQLGCEVAFLSRSGKDENSRFLRFVLQKNGAQVYGPQLPGRTSQVLCLITPDRERSFLFQGDKINGTPKTEDLEEALLKSAQSIHIEGYTVRNKELLMTTIEIAQKYKIKISMDLGSFVLVQENREFLRREILENIDILFGNRKEMLALFGTERAIDQGLKSLSSLSLALKGPEGCSVYWKGKKIHFCTDKVEVIDTSGGSDLFASGLLFGLIKEWSLEKSVTLANYIGGAVITVVGPELSEEQWMNAKKKFNVSR